MKKSASQQARGGEPPAEAHEDLVWLLGQPHLSDYLEFVRDKVIGGAEQDPRALADEWRAANDHYHALEVDEAGIAESAECLPLPKALKPLAKALGRYPYYRDTYDTLPTEIRMVELSKLIASQSSVSPGFSGELKAKLGRQPSDEDLFRFCLPTERPQPPAQARRVGSNRWLFTSDSTDFRLHRSQLLDPAQIARLATFGPASHVLALPVGFGSNFLSVVKSDNRLLLQNGYHRAYTLLAAGITHAPAVVQTVTRKDELAIAANEEVVANAPFYFLAARPPLLRDYLNPKTSKRLRAHRMQTSVEIEVKTRTTTDYRE